MMRVADIIRPLAIRGVSPTVIAERTGVDYDTVRGTMSRMRRAGVDIPRHPSHSKRRTAHPYRMQVEIAAKSRGIPYVKMKRLILSVIAREGLIDAILDDG